MYHPTSGMSDSSASAAWLQGVLKQRSGKSHTYMKYNTLFLKNLALFETFCLLQDSTGATQKSPSEPQHYPDEQINGGAACI